MTQKIRAECFEKKFATNVLPPEDFHIVTLTVIHHKFKRYYPGTGMTASLVEKARKAHQGGAVVGGEKTRTLSFIISITVRNSFRGKNSIRFFCKEVGPNIFP